MSEPGHADDGFFLRRIATPEVRGIEVCGVEDIEPTQCKLLPEGTPEFAVAEKLLDLLESMDGRQDVTDDGFAPKVPSALKVGVGSGS